MTPAQAIQKCKSAFVNIPYFRSNCDVYSLPVSPVLRGEKLGLEHAPGVNDRNILMTQLADGSFVDDAGDAGVAKPGWSWNSRFTDLDQDGWQDLLVMTGIWLSPSRSQTNIFYHNEAGKLTEATEAFGFTDVVPSYSYVSFDFDRDGDIDVVRDISSMRMIVHRNDRPAGKALWVRLRDLKGNRMGIGATVTICTGGVIRIRRGSCQMRDIKASGGFQSFDPIAAHFGLGKAGAVSLIQVRWPDGEISKIRPEAVLKSGEIIINRG